MARRHRFHRLCRRLAPHAVLALLLSASGALQADEGRHAPPRPLLPAYQAECGACHLAYPPGLLPPASWQRLMHGLGQHFGSDASLDPATVAQLADWLQREAAAGRRASTPPPPQDRISRSAWFVRHHREVDSATWQRPAVRSAAHCAACHPGAERGNFDEHQVRIPR